MLKFILGRPLSGKTFAVIKKIKELSEQGKNSVVIVPEQFTFETEKLIVTSLGDSASQKVTVLSFTRLYDELGRHMGGITSHILTDAQKHIFMNRALRALKDELGLWGKYTESLNFAGSVLDAVGEFKINSITPEILRNTALTVESPTLSAKLNDIALIFEKYDTLVGERLLDPADLLSKVSDQLERFAFFAGKTVFIDSFKGFTGQQYKIIKQIMTQAEDVYVTFTDDPVVTGEYCIYSNIRKAERKMEAIAKSRNMSIAKPLITDNPGYVSASLCAVERIIAGVQTTFTDCDDGNVQICCAETVFDEAEYVARNIKRLIREEGYRYRDFVIIARDEEKYKPAVSAAMKRNGINCFYDRKIPLSAFPMSVAALSAISALDFSSQNILAFHKTGLGCLVNDEISKLENYAFVWNIKGEQWLKEWNMDPRGLTNDPRDESVSEELKELNRLRERAIKPIVDFKSDFSGNVSNMSAAIVKLFENCNSSEGMKKIYKSYKNENNDFYADSVKQSYDAFMKVLDSMVSSFGEGTVSKKDYHEALKTALSFENIGAIPQTLDETVFGSADRIRSANASVAFILGANQGEFPKNISGGGLFRSSERSNLIRNGLELSDNSVEAQIDEEYLVYCNLCKPSKKLFISYCKQSLKGEVSEPSAFVKEISEALGISTVYFPNSENEMLLPETCNSAYSEYCRTLNFFPEKASAIKQALNEMSDVSFGSDPGSDIGIRKACLSKETAGKLYGNRIHMSASRFDTLNRCPYSYFCKYGLKLKKLEAADFNVLQRGTIVHYVFERIISEYKKGIAELERDILSNLVDRYINEYLDGVSGFADIRNNKTEFIISRISRTVKEVIYHISDEMKQSSFSPVACEYKIGDGGDIPAARFPYDGGEIILTGSIDRVDEYNGYIRIIDYKTGSKAFKLPDVLVGLNMQMLIYLYCVIRGRNLPDEKSAGILYMPSKRDLNDTGMAMNGLLPGDPDIVRAMEPEEKGEYVPKLSLTKSGTVSKRLTSFIPPEGFTDLFDHVERIMNRTGNELASGDISVSPIDGRESAACKYCDFAWICGIEDCEIPKVEKMSNSQVLDILKGETENEQ